MADKLIIKQATHGCIPHKFQDTEFGPNRRAFNETADKPPKLRCTVCGKEQTS